MILLYDPMCQDNIALSVEKLAEKLLYKETIVSIKSGLKFALLLIYYRKNLEDEC